MEPPAGETHVFDLNSVCWGYRDIFKKIIEDLYHRGSLGEHNRRVTDKFFSVMESKNRQLFDHVLKEFLEAVAGTSSWIFDLPAIFEEVMDVGIRFADVRLHYGITYFRILNRGGFGRTPAHVRHLVNCIRRLLPIDHELAFSFLHGYGKLVDRLSPQEIDLYLQGGLRLFSSNRESSRKFLAVTLRSSEVVIQSLSHECRLLDMIPWLERLLKALAGYRVEIADLSCLDSDELIERGSREVLLYRWLYLPARNRLFDDPIRNRSWYLLQVVAAGGMLRFQSFPRIHGYQEFRSAADLIGPSLLRQNIFTVFEYARVLRRITVRWPGAEGLVRFGIDMAFQDERPKSGADSLFADLVRRNRSSGNPAESVFRLIDSSVNVFSTADLLTDKLTGVLLETYPGLDKIPLRSIGFLPDFFYSASVSAPPRSTLIADMKERARAHDDERENEQGMSAMAPEEQPGSAESSEAEDEDKTDPIGACYVYDEWCQAENDYYPDYCRVYEKQAKNPGGESEDWIAESAKVRRIFELIKPQITHREKHLPDGESIDQDLLLEYLVLRRKEPSPEVKFFEKPLIRRRDLAVLLLLDVSGSTGEPADKQRIIDIEKKAAFILGQGLSVLGDQFSICGFSGHGRDNCVFVVFKDFHDPWNRQSRARLSSAWPMNSTRIGAALRHGGYKLSRMEARQRLIILITDGKPSDTAYDPTSRYAQHDVRMACEENKKLGIHTFGISTQENSLADMQIMFPHQRFAILKRIDQLTQILPRLYIRMTA